MKKYTKQQIIDMLKRNCDFDCGFGADEEDCCFNGITLHILSDEKDYGMLCDLLGIEESVR